MTEESIKNRIYLYLKKQPEHIITEHITEEYYNMFWNNVSSLVQANILCSVKSVDKISTKLQIKGTYNRDKCLQGISEMMFWLYAIKRKYTFEIDKQLHLKDENNHSDVDIQIINNNFQYNIEVKTPKQVKQTKENILKITVPFRSFENIDKHNNEIEKVHREVTDTIINNSDGKYRGYKQAKIDDNKMLEYLKSCQSKFTQNSNSINVLALSVTSDQMQNYWGYMYNPFSGIFTDQFIGKFSDKDGKLIYHTDFDKVDVVYLTNIVEGHIRHFNDFESWNLEKYCSIMCINPFSQRTMRKMDIDVYKGLLEILPNDTIRFAQERDEMNKQGEITGIPTDPIFFSEYLYNHYHQIR